MVANKPGNDSSTLFDICVGGYVESLLNKLDKSAD